MEKITKKLLPQSQKDNIWKEYLASGQATKAELREIMREMPTRRTEAARLLINTARAGISDLLFMVESLDKDEADLRNIILRYYLNQKVISPYIVAYMLCYCEPTLEIKKLIAKKLLNGEVSLPIQQFLLEKGVPLH